MISDFITLSDKNVEVEAIYLVLDKLSKGEAKEQNRVESVLESSKNLFFKRKLRTKLR